MGESMNQSKLMLLKSISQQFYMYQCGGMIWRTYQMAWPFLPDCYVDRIISEGQTICKQFTRRQEEMIGKKGELRVIHKELMKMCSTPDMELLQVRIEPKLENTLPEVHIFDSYDIVRSSPVTKVGVSPGWKYYKVYKA